MMKGNQGMSLPEKWFANISKRDLGREISRLLFGPGSDTASDTAMRNWTAWIATSVISSNFDAFG